MPRRFQGVARLATLAGLLLLSPPEPVTGYELVAWQGELPDGAITAGETEDGSPLHVCTTSNWGGQQPGWLRPGGTCHVAWGGHDNVFEEDLLILTDSSSASGDWVEMSQEGVPDGAFRVGSDDSGPIYVCRVEAWGGVFPGKLTEDGWCYVAYDGEEHYHTQGYMVLID